MKIILITLNEILKSLKEITVLLIDIKARQEKNLEIKVDTSNLNNSIFKNKE